jgi:predicted ATP-grasp superfamily ATP-dependent carboligase
MTTPEPPLRDPWLVAAWPGMGSVALAAASYLAAKLEGREIETIVRREYFEINAVAIEKGVVRRPMHPKSTLHLAHAPDRDLLFFIGEAQPSHKGYEFCHEIIDLALARGVRRIVTFAAMATPVHPSADPRVFGVASESGLLPLLARHDVGVLAEGQISGLNGVLLAAAAERGVEAICLLGELPFFAVGIPNPKASLAVLRAFQRISDVSVDLGELETQAQLVEKGLVDLLERASKQAEAGESDEEKQEISFKVGDAGEPEAEPGPPPETTRRIEELFRRAMADKSAAIMLKAELDKHGLFKKYEDRFLDLFKKDEHG